MNERGREGERKTIAKRKGRKGGREEQEIRSKTRKTKRKETEKDPKKERIASIELMQEGNRTRPGQGLDGKRTVSKRASRRADERTTNE